ncbi:MAG TPA: DUF6531 domain-containing protein [Actinocrinis sp.]|uniref:DUF6531 domain-containing protein n=1 Tax=Actinocrinis sp. TaxID=1920516 RepID=UPI002D4EF245|nr:DUF6531 domain-containing protein [Actinocrinis sp.]HZU56169.1 DUF6531 domain-containing protein [Actinocrinis sp.]
MSSGIARALEEGVANDLRPALQDAGKALENAVRSVAHGAEGVAARTEATEADVLGKITAISGKDADSAIATAESDATRTAGNLEGDGNDLSGAGHAGQPSEGNGATVTGGDPVDVVSGQMIASQTDLVVLGLLPLVLRRAYASAYLGGRLFGSGWSSTLDQRMVIDSDGIHYAGDDAQILNYAVPTQPGQQVLPADGARWPLSWNRAADEITIEDPARGYVRHFTTLGATRNRGTEIRALTAISDRNGHRITFVRDEEGIPSEVQHSGGHRVAVDTAYTSAGWRIEALRLLDGTSGGQGTTIAGYHYDRRGRLTGVTNSSGLPYLYEYDDHDRITAWIDRNNHRYEYTYDDQGRVMRGEGEDGLLSATFTYDPGNRVTTVTDSLGHPTEYHYDANQHVTKTVDALGHETTTDYDRHGRLLSRTDALGRVTRFTLDDHGQPTRIDRPDGTTATVAYNELQQPVRVIEPGGTQWRYSYDERGNLTAVTDPVGAVTVYVYDERGHLCAATDALGNTTSYETDGAGAIVRVVDPSGAVTAIERDAFERPVAVTDPLGGVTRTGWTVEGLVAWQTLPDGSRMERSYDPEGNTLRATDAAGNTLAFEYGPFNLLTAKVDAAGVRHRFRYDSELRVTEVVNPHDLVWRYTYDAVGNLTAETDFDQRTVSYRHDAADQLIELVNGAGQTVRVTRDAAGRVVERQAGQDAVHRFDFDAAGRLIRAVGNDCVLEYARDPRGRVLTESVNGRVMAHEYDLLGRRVKRTTPSGTVSHWTYDAAGRAETLTGTGGALGFQRDALGRETTRFLGPGAALTQSFDLRGRLTAQAIWSYEQGSAGSAAGASGSDGYRLLEQREYTYRADGYPAAITDTLRGTRAYELDHTGRVTAVNAAAWSETYAYDAMGNLTHATWPTDAAGGADAPADTGAADEQGEREFAGTLVRRAGRTRYEHDGQGRITRIVRRTLSGQSRTWTYAWDAEDRLTEAVTPDGTVWRYRYDPLGRRIGKSRLSPDGSLAHETHFVWDGTLLAEESLVDAQGAGTATSWDWEPGTHRPVAQTRRATWADDAPQAQIDLAFHAIVTDLVGTPAELVSPDGAIAWRSTTNIWGHVISVTSDGTECPLGAPGQYRDEETGLAYNVLRYYDSASGSYASPDPLGLYPAANNHAYVANPLVWSDPLGLMPCGDQYVDLYHGTNSAGAAGIRANGVDPSFAPRPRDFGNGFYTTRDLSQAQQWASRYGSDAQVLHFRVKQSDLDALNSRTFTETDPDLPGFVRHYRSGATDTPYDMVEGPMLGNPRPFMRGAPPRWFGNQVVFFNGTGPLLDSALQP